MLGDETTFHPVCGYGWINYFIGGHQFCQLALYVPALGKTTLLSVKQHMCWQGDYFHAEDNEAILAFPNCQIQFDITPEISIPIHPAAHSTSHYAFDEAAAVPIPSLNNHVQQSIDLVSKHVTTCLPDPEDHLQFHQTVQLMCISPNNATMSSQATPDSIGYDVTSTQHVIIPPGNICEISTSLSTALPNGMYIRIAPRSSNALKHLTIEEGVVDGDNHGEIKVLMKNNNQHPITIRPYEKIAQFIFEKVAVPFIQLTTKLPPSI
jgi:dUTP pyrophosphatase